MRKIKSLICMLIMIYAISSISYAKGTVSGKGTKEDPYKLNMGEGIIDIYYGEDLEEDRKESASLFYFEFTGGNKNAANYLVEHNADKHRVRFTLMGDKPEDRVVVASTGINYIQAGAICKTLTSGDDEKVQTPYYKITATETFVDVPVPMEMASVDLLVNSVDKLYHEYELGNGYIRVNNVLGANVSNYSTSYIFSKSNLDFNTAYEITPAQVEAKARMSFTGLGSNTRLKSENVVSMQNVMRDINGRVTYENYVDLTLSGTVNIVYCFEGTNSKISNSEGEGPASFIEKIISKVLLAVGDSAIKVLGLGGNAKNASSEEGTQLFVTIDSLVFNEYPKTIVDLWGNTGSTNSIAKKVVNFWYKVFKAWAIVLFIILLTYIGIKTVLYSGTPEQKNVRRMLEGWLVGVLMLFCLPFLFKYMIIINDLVVDIVRTNSRYSVYAYYTFEDQYESMGGQEDGEDSTTDIVARLENAKNDLLKDLDKKNNDLDVIEEELEEALELKNNVQSGVYYEMMQKGIEEARNGIKNSEKEQYYKDGASIVTTEDIEARLREILSDVYTPEVIQREIDKIRNGGEVDYWVPEFDEKISDYVKNLTLWRKADNQEGASELFRNSVKGFAMALESEYTYDIYIADVEKDYEDTLAEREAIEEKLAGIDMAISRAENSDTDLIGLIRKSAGETLKLLYVIVWFILIFQVILLLIFYFKRLFMVMVLVSVFPLVAVAYTYEKIRGSNSSILKNWMQDYTINVFIQTIHAILYVTLVELGYSVFIANNDNWLIFLISVFCILTAEPIFKNILGLKGVSVNDLKSSATNLIGASVAIGSMAGMLYHTRRDLKNIDAEYKNNEAKIEAKQEKKDSRRDTLRRAFNNFDEKHGFTNSTLANVRHGIESSADNVKEKARRAKARARMIKRKADMVNKVAGNIASVAGGIAGGIAAGGEAGDFATSTGVAKALSGSSSEETKLTPEAQERENKIKATSEVKNVSTENANDGSRSANYSGPGYDDYSYDGSSGNYNGGSSGNGGTGSGGTGTGTGNLSGGENPEPKWRKPSLKTAYMARLEEQKTYSEKKWNVYEEDEK